jgi:peptidoglycan hydrolase-like protein with peptidoglycan-binding domain
MRALNLQALTADLQSKYPGIVIYGIGDAAHRAETSDHNEDDTPGVRTEQTDADDNPEHRAIDAMISGPFSTGEAEALVQRMLNDPETLARLYYIIYNRRIWSRKNGWVENYYGGSNPHTDHVHFDGFAGDDENGSHWAIVFVSPNSQPPATPSTGTLQRGSGGTNVGRIQQFFRNVFPAYRHTVSVKPGMLITVDNNFGPQTEAWVKEFQRRTGLSQDGIVGPNTWAMLRKYGFAY